MVAVSPLFLSIDGMCSESHGDYCCRLEQSLGIQTVNFGIGTATTELETDRLAGGPSATPAPPCFQNGMCKQHLVTPPGRVADDGESRCKLTSWYWC